MTQPKMADFDFLAWVVRVYFFRPSLYSELTSIGADKITAQSWSNSTAVHAGNITRLYEDFGRHDHKLWNAFMQDALKHYKALMMPNAPTPIR